jgi:hypothetical protein
MCNTFSTGTGIRNEFQSHTVEVRLTEGRENQCITKGEGARQCPRRVGGKLLYQLCAEITPDDSHSD